MGLAAARVRELVAGLPGTVESVHHGHPDFRVQLSHGLPAQASTLRA